MGIVPQHQGSVACLFEGSRNPPPDNHSAQSEWGLGVSWPQLEGWRPFSLEHHHSRWDVGDPEYKDINHKLIGINLLYLL